VASGFTALHAAVAGGHVEACKLLIEAGARPATASAARRSAVWTACVKGHREVALLLLEAGADPYAAAQGGESAIDALRRIGGRSSMDLHAELTSRVASRGAAHVATPDAAATAAAAVAAAAGGGSEDDEEGEEEGEEEEGEEEDDEAEREAAKALAASAPREVMIPSVHPHPLEPCVKSNYCDQRGSGCNYHPTTYSCVECSWHICQVCFDKAPRDEAAPSGAKDSLADLLHEISVAVHDEEEGDAAEDDMGEAILDDDDDDDNVDQLFRDARKNAMPYEEEEEE